VRAATTAERLVVSDHAHLILLYHIMVDSLRESSRRPRPLGTTKGHRPAYEQGAAHGGARLRAARLRRCASASSALEALAPTIRALGASCQQVSAIVEAGARLADRIVPLLGDSSKLVRRDACRQERDVRRRVGRCSTSITALPVRTSSSAIAGGAAIGVGIGPQRIDGHWHHQGLHDARRSRSISTESTMRRAGTCAMWAWSSARSRAARAPAGSTWPALRYAARCQRARCAALTKLDVLTGPRSNQSLRRVRHARRRSSDFPLDSI
jgi:adenylosuccinate synthase